MPVIRITVTDEQKAAIESAGSADLAAYIHAAVLRQIAYDQSQDQMTDMLQRVELALARLEQTLERAESAPITPTEAVRETGHRGKLTSRAELARRLGRSERTLRRYLPAVPGLSGVKIGRTVYFTNADIERIQDSFRCPYPAAREVSDASGTLRSVSTVNLSRSKSTARDALVARMKKLLDEQKKGRSKKQP